MGKSFLCSVVKESRHRLTYEGLSKCSQTVFSKLKKTLEYTNEFLNMSICLGYLTSFWINHKYTISLKSDLCFAPNFCRFFKNFGAKQRSDLHSILALLDTPEGLQKRSLIALILPLLQGFSPAFVYFQLFKNHMKRVGQCTASPVKSPVFTTCIKPAVNDALNF